MIVKLCCNKLVAAAWLSSVAIGPLLASRLFVLSNRDCCFSRGGSSVLVFLFLLVSVLKSFCFLGTRGKTPVLLLVLSLEGSCVEFILSFLCSFRPRRMWSEERV